MTIEIRLLEEGDVAVLDRVANDVFDHAVIAEQAARFLADPGHYLVVALHADTVVGIGSANEYLHPDKPLQFWINEMGVAPEYQRQGIGRQLLDVLLGVARDLGCKEVWLGTEVENVPARALYRSAGGKEENFVMYTFELGETR